MCSTPANSKSFTVTKLNKTQTNTAMTDTSNPLGRLPTALAFALTLLAVGTAPAFSQVSVDRPEMVRDLKDARKTVANANQTASQMADEMTSQKEKLDRNLRKLNRAEEGTRAYSLAYERARAAQSKIMVIRKEMLDKKMAAYGSAIGHLDSALKTRKDGTGLAKNFEKESETIRTQIKQHGEEGEKVEVIRDYGNPDEEYRRALSAQLQTLRHEIGVKKQYIEKLKANAQKVRKNSQNELFDRLRTLKSALKRRRVEFRFEKKHLQNTAKRLRQELSMRQKLTAFNQFYTEMQKLSDVTEGLEEEVKSIYEDFGEAASSFGGSLPNPKSLENEGGSPVMDANSYDPVSSFKQDGDQ